MPFTLHQGARIYWRSDGDPAKPALLLACSLGTDHALWSPVLSALLPHFRVLRFDLRGHGASDAPAGDYSMAQLAGDALAVADAAGAQQFHWCGVSIGGMIGMHVALRAPARVLSLVLSNTSAAIPREVFEQRIAVVQAGGMASVADAVLSRFFTPAFIARGNAHFHSVRSTLLGLDPQGYCGCCAAIRDMQLAPQLPALRGGALVIVGEHDSSTPPAMGEAIAAALPGAQLLRMATAHLSHSERPAEFARKVVEYCLPPQGEMTLDGLYTHGLERRKAVLGADYVASRLQTLTDFNRDFQRYITQQAWGSVWTRGVLDDETRRLLVLAITASLSRWDEYRLHLRAALDAGLEAETLKETLIHLSVYAGVPAANTAFHMAQEMLAARGASQH
ncbi:MAG: 3-oxoadipate enol-lactonase [Betaproteobacteria bacterium]|nr:3-oxoadipate enol-lactonase [Betaproteobacteria bacterium]MDE2047185.1 3-oxoadipate enol-lactonase [Betaproteobacteria bacterium]